MGDTVLSLTARKVERAGEGGQQSPLRHQRRSKNTFPKIKLLNTVVMFENNFHQVIWFTQQALALLHINELLLL
jgi:hypothetical protein